MYIRGEKGKAVWFWRFFCLKVAKNVTKSF
jgi:hypothetical protein